MAGRAGPRLGRGNARTPARGPGGLTMDATMARRLVLPADSLVDGPTALRPWRDADLRALVLACQDPEIPRWTRVPTGYRDADARVYLQQRYDMAFAGLAAAFAIVRAPDGALLGSISLM